MTHHAHLLLASTHARSVLVQGHENNLIPGCHSEQHGPFSLYSVFRSGHRCVGHATLWALPQGGGGSSGLPSWLCVLTAIHYRHGCASSLSRKLIVLIGNGTGRLDDIEQPILMCT